MRRAARRMPLLLALAALWAPTAAQADFGFKDGSLDFAFTDADGDPVTQAGAHPFAQTTNFDVNTLIDPGSGVEVPDGAFRDVIVRLPPGFVGTPTPGPRCDTADFLEVDAAYTACPDSTAIGVTETRAGLQEPGAINSPVYNLVPPPGAAAKIGFVAVEIPVTIEVGVNPDKPHNLIARVTNIAQSALFYGSRLSLWGVPADPAHDPYRGSCVAFDEESESDIPGETASRGVCPVSIPEVPFLTTPRACRGPLEADFFGRAWVSGATDAGIATSPATTGCARLPFSPRISAETTTTSASAPSGLEFSLRVEDEGIAAPEGIAHSDIERIEVTLPEGMRINPSQAEGLDVCSESELGRERAGSQFGAGCPAASKIGSIEATTPLLDGVTLKGSVFVAEPHANPFDSLIALYVVLRHPGLGILVRQAGEVTPDRESGQVSAVFEELPQFPLEEVSVRLREGARSPLITPPTCGDYEVRALFAPYADPGSPRAVTDSFEVRSGVGGGECPSGDAPFAPGFDAGTLSNQAGSHSPFLMRITRRDGDQDLTRFDAVLPPGLTAKLAGVPWCPEAAIARAKGRDGKDELARPSCPAASRIGSVLGGAGVGSQLTYVPGSLYLAGPVGGAPLSVLGIVPAVAGPFDVGTIVVRQALDLDPITGQAKVDGALSDPIPHILAGIPLAVRDIRVSADRPDFTLNPTSCEPMATRAGIWGGGSHLFSTADDFPVLRQARFQAAGCAALGFEPKLAIKLKGGVRRGAHPALRAHVVPRPGDANFSRAVVTLPRSAFLEQAHIRTICTRVQFAAGPGNGAACPPGARYGFARAWSPLVDGPVQGPVYLRSSDNNLPDLVAALTGPPSARVQVELSARIDSVKGGIRSTFTGIPDLPVSRFILDMQGGKKGLIVNSRHLCHKPGRNRAKANLRGQNGRFSRTKPRVIATTCQKRRKNRRAGRAALSAARSLR